MPVEPMERADRSTEDAPSDWNALVQAMFYQLCVFQVVFDNTDQVTQSFLLLLQMLKKKKREKEGKSYEIASFEHLFILFLSRLYSFYYVTQGGKRTSSSSAPTPIFSITTPL